MTIKRKAKADKAEVVTSVVEESLPDYNPGQDTQMIPVSSLVFDTNVNYRPIYQEAVEKLKKRFLSGEKQMETVQVIPVENGYAPFAHQQMALAFKELHEDGAQNGRFEFIRATIHNITPDEAHELSIINQESLHPTSFLAKAKAIKRLNTQPWKDSNGVEHPPRSIASAAKLFGVGETIAIMWLNVLDSGDKELIQAAERGDIPPRIAAEIARKSRDTADPKDKAKQLETIKKVRERMEELLEDHVPEAKGKGGKPKPKAATAASRARQALREVGTGNVGATLKEVKEVFEQMSKDAATTQNTEMKMIGDVVAAYIVGKVKRSSHVYAKIREAITSYSVRERDSLVDFINKRDKGLAKQVRESIKAFDKARAEAADEGDATA